MTASPANTPPPAPADLPSATAPAAVPELREPRRPRRERRERVLIGLAALGALGALGTSLVALNRDVPFLDVAVARAAAQGEIDTPLAVTVPPVGSTTTSTTAAVTTTAVATTVPAVLAATDTTLDGPDPATADADHPDDAQADATDDVRGDDDEQAWSDDADWTPDAGVAATPVTTPVTDTTWLPPTPEPTNPPPTDTTPTTAAPVPSTAAPTTTVVTGPPALVVQLACKNGSQGLTLTLTANGDGTLKRLLVKGFPAACKKDDVRVVLTDGAGQVLAEASGRIRSSSPYNLDLNTWSPVAVDQIAGVSLTDL